jgi:hypothetical protein
MESLWFVYYAGSFLSEYVLSPACSNDSTSNW